MLVAENDLSHEHQASPDQREYPGKPIILGDANSIDQDILHWTRSGNAILRIDGEKLVIPPSRQKNHIEPAFEAVEANLQPGTEYESFIQEQRKLQSQAVNESKNLSPKYGEIVYFPHLDVLAHLAPVGVRHLALLARNEFQIQDPGQELSWQEQRNIFGSQVIGILGASVASLAAHRLVQTLKPGSTDIINPPNPPKGGIKIGDLDVYNHAVWGRRRHGLMEIGVNKAVSTIREMHEIDPSIPAWVYPEGIDPYGNVEQFIHGHMHYGEPPINRVIEAIDSIEEKFALLKILRAKGIETWRITDLGGAYQIDRLPFDRIPDFPIAIGTTDGQLESALSKALSESSRENWMDFALLLTGPHWEKVPEFKAFIEEQSRSPFSKAIPQLGIAAEAAASAVAYGVGSTLLGWDWPHRLFVDIRTGNITREWYHRETGNVSNHP